MRTRRIGMVAVVLLASAASGDETAPTPLPEETQAWRGRYCDHLGCGAARGAAAGTLAGFGAAAVGAAWWSRRNPRNWR